MRRLVVAGLALALVAGACGGAASKATNTERAPKVSTVRLVSSAADVAAEQRSVRISGEVAFSAAGEQGSVPIEGAIDFEHDAVEMSMSLSGLSSLVDGAASTGDVEIRMVDGVMYMNLGSVLGSTGVSDPGRPWVSVDVSSAGGQDVTQNPADILSALRGAGDVELVGHGALDGVDVDHYRAEIDLGKAVEQLPAEQRTQAEAGLRLLGSSFPVDVWIDDDGLPRRIAIDLNVKGSAHVTERIDFSDWGADVTVVAPPADEVRPLNGAATGAANAL